MINYRDLIKEQHIFVFLPLIILIASLAGTIGFGGTYMSVHSDLSNKTQEYETLVAKKTQLQADIAKQKREENSPDIKKIYTLEGLRFGSNASFAPLFDDMVSIAKASGVRIRSVDYNYAPEGDPIFSAKVTGVNVCELTTTIVGNYSAIQAFLKTLLAETYLINIAEVEIVSWKRDKSVLIANLKLRYYTKT